jgi:hypothetical protein
MVSKRLEHAATDLVGPTKSGSSSHSELSSRIMTSVDMYTTIKGRAPKHYSE